MKAKTTDISDSQESEAAQTKVICLTPVANEAFQLDRFLQCTSLWADHIVVGYQASIDETLAILQKHEKVTVVKSPNTDWNELVMRSLLYEEARKIEAHKRIILNLDADELLSANYMNSGEWKAILQLPKGSIFRMPWSNLKPNMSDYWVGNMIEVGFVDDSISTLTGSIMHMGRVPWPQYDIKIMQCSEIKLLHYAFTNVERNLSKKTWYQAYEKVGKSEFGPQIFRKYNRKGAFPPLSKIDPSWFYGYGEFGIDVTSISYSYDYSHDYRLLNYLDEYGAEYFKMCNIWHKDWVQFATGKKESPERFSDPRTKVDKLIFRYMHWSIGAPRNFATNKLISLIDWFLKLAGYSSR